MTTLLTFFSWMLLSLLKSPKLRRRFFLTSGIWISDIKRWLKFSRTMPSLEAKKAKM